MWTIRYVTILGLVLAPISSGHADECVPDCNDRFCGDDGCGGSCGSCAKGDCVVGRCLTTCPEVDHYGSTRTWPAGCCEGDRLVRCNGSVLVVSQCLPGQCRWDSQAWSAWGEAGAYSCVAQGDPDPRPAPVPSQCELLCSPQCWGRECGDDGCGSVCGTCPEGQSCDADGKCCVGSCEGRVCGSDGCVAECGTCPPGLGCSAEGQCCVGNCDGKVCGSDGCGGLCGACKSGNCLDGKCVTECQVLPEAGCCFEGDSLACGSNGSWDWDSCNSNSPCSWSQNGHSYSCYGELPQDPTGQFPRECHVDCENNCPGRECGDDGCGGSCGECPLGSSCWGNACCEPNCVDKQCGDDGCGGSCGDCVWRQLCLNGKCKADDGCTATNERGCDECACEVCVCKIEHYCCWDRWDLFCVLACEADCGGCKAKPPCVPDCPVGRCGDDGCGGSCGECPDGQVCDEGICYVTDCAGKCGGKDPHGADCPGGCGLESYCVDGVCLTDCAYECAEIQCGFGKCGGPCGSPSGQCELPNQVCIDGLCYNDGANVPPESGCCNGNTALIYTASNANLDIDQCEDDLADACEWKRNKAPECPEWDYECEPPDPMELGGHYECGGSHWDDPSGVYPLECNLRCLGDSCMRRECGPDGCGGWCGQCPEGSVCDQGQCCLREMEGRECGPDGCGGIVWCPVGEQCSPEFLCVPCTFDCAGKECGPDGCGGSCGPGCLGFDVCVSGKCLDPYQKGCQGINWQGCCSGELLFRCSEGHYHEERCGPSAHYCGWSEQKQRYACLTDGNEDPSGKWPKECLAVCYPSCHWRNCGDDGCGGSCGTCKPDQECRERNCVTVRSDASQEDVVAQQEGETSGMDSGRTTRSSGCCAGVETSTGGASWLWVVVLVAGLLRMVVSTRRSGPSL